MNIATLAIRPAEDDIGNSFVMRQLGVGAEYFAAGQVDEAISAYRRGLAELDNGSRTCVPVDKVAELHARLGDAGMANGDLELAATNYKAALRLAPYLTSCWCNLGNVYLKKGQPLEAITLYAQALSHNPVHWPSRVNSVQALMATEQYLLAHALLTEMVGERPDDASLYNQLGKLHFALDDPDAALTCFERAIVLNPNDFDSIYWVGGLKQRAGDAEAAAAAYGRAAQLQPLIRRPAARFPAEFHVLALYAPFAGNTPTEYLFKDAVYDTDILALSDREDPDMERLGDPHIVVNLISDADQAVSVLPLAARVAGRLGKPVINDPRQIQKTTRENVALLLDGIAGCRVPCVTRLEAGAAISPADLQAALSFPMLARPTGTHGGDDFEKIGGLSELTAFLSRHPDAAHYLIDYVDYRSADGYFRKYRFIFVDEQVLPYHLAIGDDWKLHHDSTDMEHHQWMQAEEAAFLTNPAAVFTAANFQALREIQRLVGLDFFGIDCGLDQAVHLVVFEVNASMLVHGRNEKFPYKNDSVARIKQAFGDMLCKAAVRTRGHAGSTVSLMEKCSHSEFLG